MMGKKCRKSLKRNLADFFTNNEGVWFSAREVAQGADLHEGTAQAGMRHMRQFGAIEMAPGPRNTILYRYRSTIAGSMNEYRNSVYSNHDTAKKVKAEVDASLFPVIDEAFNSMVRRSLAC